MKVRIANKYEKEMIVDWFNTIEKRFDGINLKYCEDKRMVVVHDGNNYLGALMFCYDDEIDIAVNPQLIGRGYGLHVLKNGLDYLWRRVENVEEREPCFFANCVNEHSAKLFDKLGYKKDITGDYYIARWS